MDIKAKIEELAAKITGNKDLLSKFKANPTDVVKGLIGDNVDSSIISKIADGVKAKIDVDNIAGAASKLGGLFKKK